MSNIAFPQRPFWLALFAVSLAPFALILGSAAITGGEIPGLSIIIIIASAHIAATAAIFGDGDFQPITRGNRVRFFLLPAALAVASLIIVLALPAGAWNLVFTGVTAWQLQHYQRQSFGIAAFGCKASGVAMPPGFSRAIDLTVVAGMLGVLANGTQLAFPAALAPATRLLAVAIYLVPLFWLAKTFVRAPTLRRAPIAGPSVAIAVLFLVPALIPSNQTVVFWSYAIAHGAQYFLFTLVLGWAAPNRGRSLRIQATAALLGVIAFPLMNQTEAWTAIYLAIPAWHFLVDAKVWKLREAPQRAIISARFSEILKPPAPAASRIPTMLSGAAAG